MTEGTPYVELRIDLKSPAELSRLVGFFSSIANQFETYIRREHPNLKGDAQLFVKDIRQGSIIVELIPVVLPLIENMDRVLVVDGFVRRLGGLLNLYTSGQRQQDLPKNEIKDLMNAVTLIANDPEGKSAISSVEYHATKTTKRINIEFDTQGAKKAEETLQQQRAALDLAAYEVFENRMLVFVRTSVRATKTGERTDLKAIIESIHPKPLAVTYETDLARERIEAEIREDELNVYQKGFFVDVYAERLRGKPVAYRITAVRDIISLPDDDGAAPERLTDARDRKSRRGDPHDEPEGDN
jgi:hypothetical protein